MALGVLVLIAVLLALLVDRIFFDSSIGPTGAGSGVAATQARSVPAFTGVAAAGDNNVIVRVGARQSVIVHADSNLLRRVRTRVRSGRLVIGTTPGNLSAKSPMFVAVSLPSLDRLRLQGDANIVVSGINSRNLTVELPVSGNVRATGTATKLDATNQRRGNRSAAPAQRARRESRARWRGEHHGHRDAQSHREGSGSGTGLYGGNPPHVTQRVSGSGTISAG